MSRAPENGPREAGHQAPETRTCPVLPAHRFDEAALARWLGGRLPGAAEGFALRQFQGGQSNPTFLLTCRGGQRYVLRKKPPGELLPKAHQVEREYRVMAALAPTPVPVPGMRLLCEDPGPIGTAFYVMDYVEGRIAADPAAPDLSPEQRRPSRLAMVETLARLHAVDWRAVGLAGFGRPEGYVERQVSRWSRQYEASRQGGGLPDMDRLAAWLSARVPAEQETAIAHGDYRVGNLVLHAEEPRIVAVLDWELATLGHPVADLAYFCMPYHLPAGVPGVRGLQGLDLAALGIPGEEEILAAYCEHSGRPALPHWRFFLAFSLFRLAAILQGVAARAALGNASNADAREVGSRAGLLAAAGRRIAEGT
ncbi:MAG: phosphotransferase [Tistlia sp.]|uniref:phosphotransferase n=1 Tax=Tistlia sp. TaxID=3057121 RepID=UPI0034A30FE5